MKFFRILFVLSIWSDCNNVFSQCTPPMAETCEESNVLCSLDEVNGYTCNNPSTIASSCSPLCSQGGVGHNTSWWAFVCRGGDVSITLTVGGCITNQGLQYGIWQDCNCGVEIVCNSIPCLPPGSVTTITAKLGGCSVYYLWIDGCSGDICDFTLNTTGGGAPSLSNLSSIQTAGLDSNKVLNLCAGACNVPFYVDEQPGGCRPNYLWTCHGMEVGGTERTAFLDFPNEGDFEICVTAIIGNPNSGSICSQSNQECITVRVRKMADRIGIHRVLCSEQVGASGYKWHSQRITTSGIFREKFTDANCCKFDSVVEFIILEKPIPAEVFYISIGNKPYIDVTGGIHHPCVNQQNILLRNTTDPYKCDSSIILTVINVEVKVEWSAKCSGNGVELSPIFSFIKPCNLGESYEFEYRWFRKNDPLKNTIYTDQNLLVDAINEDYCIELKLLIRFGNHSAKWSNIYCETINEENIKNITKTISLHACDSAVIGGKTYYQSTQLMELITNADACDLVTFIDLFIHNSSASEFIMHACDSITINGIKYFQSGTYTQILQNSNQCDSVLTINLDISNSSIENHYYKSCDSIILGRETYFNSGSYSRQLQSVNGCDSSVYFELSIVKSNTFNLKVTSCDSTVINGERFSQSGTYKQILKNTALCDSTLTIDLSISNSSFIKHELNACDSVKVNGELYTKSGLYNQYLKSANHCDSLVSLQLNISKSNSSSLSLEVCDSVVINNIHYQTSGHYLQKLINSSGCDSIIQLELGIKPSNPTELDAGRDTSMCEGEIIRLSGIFLGSAKFLWHTSNGIFDKETNLTTNYYSAKPGRERVYLQARDECKQWLDSFEIEILPKSIVNVTGDSIGNPCKEIIFNASGGRNYIWSPEYLVNCLDPECSTVKLKRQSGNIKLMISTDSACMDPAILNLSIAKLRSDIYMPNVFSPNEDDINDFFLPTFNSDVIHNYNLQIFDRWGNQIFESSHQETGWNGVYRNARMNPGVYPYVIQYELCNGERKLKTGDVTLVR